MSLASKVGGRLRALRERLLLELDQIDWRRQTVGLRGPKEVGQKRRILICELMAMVATAKVEALLARALRPDGFVPVVLLRSRNPIIEGCYRALGPAEFVYLDEATEAGDRESAKAEAARRVAADPEFSELLSWTPDGCRVGRNVLSWVIRRLRVGRLDPRDPEHRALVEQSLAESLTVKVAIARILDRVKPQLALFNERGYTPAGEVFDACLMRGIDTIQWFAAPQSDSLVYKRYRLETRDRHPLSLGDDTWEALKRMPWSDENESKVLDHLGANYASGAWFNRQQLQTGKSIKSAEAVRAELGLDPSRKTAAIFSHILYDATFFYGESLFSDYEAWLVETVRAAIANPTLNWIVKVHPVNVWRSRMDGKPLEQLETRALAEALGPLPQHIKVLPADTDINTYSLFSTIDYGLTVRGTIGMELPCFGIPVVTAGTGRYAGRGFTIDPGTPEEYRRTLAHLHEVPPLDVETVRLARLYSFATFMLRPLRMQAFRLDYAARSYGSASLDYNVMPKAKQSGQFLRSADMHCFRAWISEREADDLLSSDVLTSRARRRVYATA